MIYIINKNLAGGQEFILNLPLMFYLSKEEVYANFRVNYSSPDNSKQYFLEKEIVRLNGKYMDKTVDFGNESWIIPFN